MTAAEFIDTLEAKELLPANMAEKLRKKTAASSKPLTAKSLARFLIEKGILSKQQAMSALVDGGEMAKVPEPEPSAVDPSGVDLPMDQLQDLSSSAEWSIDQSGGGFDAPEEAAATAGGTAKKKKSKKKGGKKGNEWDSPLLLVGGGALALLLIVGPLMWYIMFAENADNVLTEARKAMNEGAYPNAISNYERFVEEYPSNAEYSTARVELAMARIRRTLESGNVTLAYTVADEELRAVADEPDFNVAEEDLSDLLPRIARGLADRAEASEAVQESGELFKQATTALGMTNNTKYIPKSRRDNTELEGIRETLDRIERRQQSLSDLESALTAIDEAVAEKDTATAFAAQQELVEKHPSLLADKRVAEALEKISAAERDSIEFVAESIEAVNSDPASDVLTSLAIANRRQPGDAPLDGVYCAQVAGIAYGLKASTGEVQWRRHVGPSLEQTHPLTLGSDLLLIEWQMSGADQKQQSLVRVDSTSGATKWRLTLDDTFAAPVLLKDQILLAGDSGKLHVVDAASGTRQGYVKFAQPLRASPAINEQGGVIYLSGEHSSLYSLAINDFSCLGVHYSNHAPGAIAAPAAVVLDKVVFVENDGAETCKLAVYSLDGRGVIDQLLASPRLAGRVVRQPLVNGRRFVVLTDRGQIGVYEVGVGPDGDPLTTLAMRSERSGQPFVRYAALGDGNIWLGENALTKYAIAPTGNRLTVQPLADDYNRSQFVAPITVADDALLQVRARRGRAGYTVTAVNIKDGSAFWETDIATAPASNPLVSANPVAVLEADANGQVYRFDPQAIQSRTLSQSLPNPADESQAMQFDSSTLLANGGAIFAASNADKALLYTSGGAKPLKQVSLPSPLACQPTAFGEGWLAPLAVGQVFYLDAQGTEPLAAPFQPSLSPGRKVAWQPASPIDAEQFLLTDGVEKVYLVELRNEGSPALVSAAEAAVGPSPITTKLVTLGRVAFAGTNEGRLAAFQLPTLEAGQRIDLGGALTWGPHLAGELVVCSVAGGKLVAISGQGEIAWQSADSFDTPLGPPLVSGGSMVLATQSGEVFTIALASGEISGRMNAGEPLAGGPVLLDSRIVVTARDGALLVLKGN